MTAYKTCAIETCGKAILPSNAITVPTKIGIAIIHVCQSHFAEYIKTKQDDVGTKETMHLCCKCGNIERFVCRDSHGHAAYICSDCAVDLAF